VPDVGAGVRRHACQLAVGMLVFDMRRKALGVVMDTDWGRLYLRPPGGGIEWDAVCADLRPATATDRLRPALAEVNERSSDTGSTPWR
jgi:hypothetical protein